MHCYLTVDSLQSCCWFLSKLLTCWHRAVSGQNCFHFCLYVLHGQTELQTSTAFSDGITHLKIFTPLHLSDSQPYTFTGNQLQGLEASEVLSRFTAMKCFTSGGDGNLCLMVEFLMAFQDRHHKTTVCGCVCHNVSKSSASWMYTARGRTLVAASFTMISSH